MGIDVSEWDKILNVHVNATHYTQLSMLISCVILMGLSKCLIFNGYTNYDT